MTEPTPPSPHEQRAAKAFSEIVQLVVFSAIDGVALPGPEITTIVANLDLDARTVCEAMIGDFLEMRDPKEAAEFRRLVDEGFREATGLD